MKSSRGSDQRVLGAMAGKSNTPKLGEMGPFVTTKRRGGDKRNQRN